MALRTSEDIRVKKAVPQLQCVLAVWSDQHITGAGFSTPRTVAVDHGCLELAKKFNLGSCYAHRSGPIVHSTLTLIF